MDSERMRKCLEGGNSILVGTAGADCLPSCCRGVAIASRDGLRTATVYLPVATSQQVLADVATTRRLSVVSSHPISHVSLQLKGTTGTVRMAEEAERPLLQERIEQFGDVLDQIGVPRRIARMMNYWPAFAIDMTIEEVFEQTPGPNAGAPVP